ncbi:MAG TPA: TonB family protein, partial [Candidatus Babeliales bacterium]|nr:TonB family protein [Candidatus Babeliales bacterium]
NFSPATSDSSVDIGRKDLELLQLQDQLRQNVAQSWRPPLGFPRALTAVVAVVLSPTGQIEQIQVQQSSGVAVFDASVQQALSAVPWPPAAWGRSHVLTFKQ